MECVSSRGLVVLLFLGMLCCFQLFFFFLAAPWGMQDLSFLTRY